jgi:hypothetical protein
MTRIITANAVAHEAATVVIRRGGSVSSDVLHDPHCSRVRCYRTAVGTLTEKRPPDESSATLESIPMFIRPQHHLQHLGQNETRGFDMGNRPIRECRFNVGTIRAPDQRS